LHEVVAQPRKQDLRHFGQSTAALHLIYIERLRRRVQLT
jgi:hypothetical protein